MLGTQPVRPDPQLCPFLWLCDLDKTLTLRASVSTEKQQAMTASVSKDNLRIRKDRAGGYVWPCLSGVSHQLLRGARQALEGCGEVPLSSALPGHGGRGPRKLTSLPGWDLLWNLGRGKESGCLGWEAAESWNTHVSCLPWRKPSPAPGEASRARAGRPAYRQGIESPDLSGPSGTHTQAQGPLSRWIP